MTSPYVHSKIDSNTFTMGNPIPESTLTPCQSRLYPPVSDFGFGLSTTTRIRLEWIKMRLFFFEGFLHLRAQKIVGGQ
jgi:hypothetical protein